MSLFVIDTEGNDEETINLIEKQRNSSKFRTNKRFGKGSSNKKPLGSKETLSRINKDIEFKRYGEESDDECIIIPPGSDGEEQIIVKDIIPTLKKMSLKNSEKKNKPREKIYTLDDVYIDYDCDEETKTWTDARKDEMKKRIAEKSLPMKPGFEQLESVPNGNMSDRKLKKLNKIERAKTKGADWFNLPAPEMTEEVKRDLEVLQMRSVLDPKTFYKKNDLKVLPKYFHVGKVADNAADFYSSRVPKKDRKRTMVDELLADAEFQQRSKKKFKEIIAEKERVQSKAHKRASRLKKRKK